MKLSCLPVSYFSQLISGEMTIDSWVKEAAEVGCDGFDLSILFFRADREGTICRCREAARAWGIPPAVINTYSDLAHPESPRRREELAELLDDIVTAAAAGASYVRIVAGQGYPGVARGAGIGYVTEGFFRAAEQAAAVGIGLVYENHSKPGVWEYPDFSADPEVFLEIAGAIEGSGIGLLFDTANCLVAGVEPELVLQRIVNRVECVHASDTATSGALVPTVIGEGIVPFDSLLAMLRAGGFDGWISLEEASGTGRAGVERGASFIRERWESCRKK